jgi:hypothetical protein
VIALRGSKVLGVGAFPNVVGLVLLTGRARSDLAVVPRAPSEMISNVRFTQPAFNQCHELWYAYAD